MLSHRILTVILIVFAALSVCGCSGAESRTAAHDETQFDRGSQIALRELSEVQISNLALLGRVWGFLKYHHPAVTSGMRQWDYDLFRIVPSVLAARDETAAESVIERWVASLGVVQPCGRCASLIDKDIQIPPPMSWLTDAALGPRLATSLRWVYRNRKVERSQFYVSMAEKVRNPSFDHESAYASVTLPDAGYQLLALFRFWNIIEYWYPYRDVIGGNWDEVLKAFVPRIALAPDRQAYEREMLALVSTVHDTHVNVWNALDSRPPTGACVIPITLRFVENQAVVTGYARVPSEVASEVEVGDVITEIDGVRVATLLARWLPYYAASNAPARLRDVARYMTRGACGTALLTVLRNGEGRKIRCARMSPSRVASEAELTHERQGQVYRMLSPEIAYLKLSMARAADAGSYVSSAMGTKGFVIDVRGYPSDAIAFALGSKFIERSTPFVRFTTGDISNPGSFHWQGEPLVLQPYGPYYRGQVVILVDEVSISAAEYTAMALRASPHSIVVGSMTGGADGNVSAFSLPGGLRTVISGIGVFYPDKKATQRVGIIPDIEAAPTVKGIRDGRDEVLEVAVRRILGPSIPAALIQQIAAR